MSTCIGTRRRNLAMTRDRRQGQGKQELTHDQVPTHSSTMWSKRGPVSTCYAYEWLTLVEETWLMYTSIGLIRWCVVWTLFPHPPTPSKLTFHVAGHDKKSHQHYVYIPVANTCACVIICNSPNSIGILQTICKGCLLLLVRIACTTSNQKRQEKKNQ